MSRHSVSPLEQLLGLIGTALVTLAAFIWRVYTAKPDEILQGEQRHDDSH